MNVLRKLNKARMEFHAAKITKTGKNKFADYNYFELSDFLVPALQIFDRLQLSAVVSFGVELATMTLTDLEDGSQFVITSPMSTAKLKACHEVQNLGAVETYIRRYLWVTALEIVEHDAIDSSEGAETPKASTDDVIARLGKDGAAKTAAWLAGLSQEKLDQAWDRLPKRVQDQLNAAWPKETA